MKIVFILSSLGSGGAERVVSLIANYLSKEYNIYIITLSKEESFYELNHNITHIKLDLLKESKGTLESIVNTLKRVYILKKSLKSISPDINISFMTHTNIIATVASKLNKQKIIISERTVYDYYNSKIVNILRRYIYPFSDMLITQTYADMKNYIFLKNVNVIYNPIAKIDNKSYKNSKKNIILAVGRLDKQKSFDNLIKAFAKIDSTNWNLLIAGEGDEKDNLLSLIKEYKLHNVKLIGKQKDIFKYYKEASIFVLSSKKEGFPNVLIEAMSFGCAVISFDCPYGPNEIIKNEIDGILVENQNIDLLSKQMQRLINDKPLREKLSKNAIESVKKFDIDNISKKWLKSINKVINND